MTTMKVWVIRTSEDDYLTIEKAGDFGGSESADHAFMCARKEDAEMLGGMATGLLGIECEPVLHEVEVPF